ATLRRHIVHHVAIVHLQLHAVSAARNLLLYLFFFWCHVPLRDLHSFPTRRSSDLRLTLLNQYSILLFVSLLLTQRGKLALHLGRSEEHTSELQSRFDLVCRLLLEKKKAAPERTGTLAHSRTRDRQSGRTAPPSRRH